MAATYLLSTDRVVVTFNKGLRDGVINPGNWGGVVKTNGLVSTYGFIAFVVAAGVTVTATAVRGLPGLLPSVVDYNPPPFDLIGRNGIPVAGFVNFPLTVVP